jgi:TRAP-type C4-dicarboxylate transport system permease small subunit
MIIFWSLAFIVFLQFFTRYVLNDSLSWTEEIARYGLMWVTFIGGAMVTRRNTHIAVELMSNLMKPGPARTALLIFIDAVKLGFLALLAYFSVTITERMAFQRMTVFDLPMSYVYMGVALGCIGMFARQAQAVWRNYRMRWRRPHDMHDQIVAD